MQFAQTCMAIHRFIADNQYLEAIAKYYELLGEITHSELHQELLYLKRLANVELAGRDILAFKNESSRSDLINGNLWEYCSCIESVLETFRAAGRASPLQILTDAVPTMEQLIQHKQRESSTQVYLWDGQFKRDSTIVTADFFGLFKCPKGRLFDRYPNPLIYHRDEEQDPDEVSHPALCTTYPPNFVKENILSKGLRLAGIEAYAHRGWRLSRSKRREPDFTSLQSLQDVYVSNYGVSAIKYTGRTHAIGDTLFYEIDLLRKAPWLIKRSTPPLSEIVDDILREAENLLRERHGLPRIGEGWVSEMQLYDLVQEHFADAQHHVSPSWLKPQELDVYVASKKLAFEYQGIQHFEPLEFFGGPEALNRRLALDERKRSKCRSAGVVLIEWRFDEPIVRTSLLEKLRSTNIEV
jgi:hypothetical protein